jgi:hypothetical protein
MYLFPVLRRSAKSLVSFWDSRVLAVVHFGPGGRGANASKSRISTTRRPGDRATISRVSQDFGWLKQGDKPEPRMEFIATLWRMRGTSGRNIECAAFRTETGMELRTMYSPNEVIATKLFRGVDADDKLAEAADQWRMNLIAKGFWDAE